MRDYYTRKPAGPRWSVQVSRDTPGDWWIVDPNGGWWDTVPDHVEALNTAYWLASTKACYCASIGACWWHR